jgi:hypothetical protein
VQYLLGGYRYFFFAHADAIGTGHYLPIVGYFRGRPERAFYVGAGNEAWSGCNRSVGSRRLCSQFATGKGGF